MSADHEVTYRDPSKLKPYARNARTHPPEQIEQIKAAIQRWGFTNPVLIDENDLIIAGHGRVTAAVQLGIGQVRCIVIPGLSDAERRALTLADNRIAENAGWDQAILRRELGDLGSGSV